MRTPPASRTPRCACRRSWCRTVVTGACSRCGARRTQWQCVRGTMCWMGGTTRRAQRDHDARSSPWGAPVWQQRPRAPHAHAGAAAVGVRVVAAAAAAAAAGTCRRHTSHPRPRAAPPHRQGCTYDSMALGELGWTTLGPLRGAEEGSQTRHRTTAGPSTAAALRVHQRVRAALAGRQCVGHGLCAGAAV